MQQEAPARASSVRMDRWGKPPIPQEHGAWVILYAPLLVGFGVAGVVAPAIWLLLTLTVTGSFLAREAIGLLLRRRGRTGTALWAGLYVTLALAGAVPLLFLTSAGALILVGGVMMLIFAVHSLLLTTPARKRLDRSEAGEVLGASALTLTAPAAYAAASGRLDLTAGLLWLGCWLYFSGGILYVKMWLEAAKRKRDWTPAVRRSVLLPCLLYHLFVAALFGGVCLWLRGIGAVCLALAVAPALYRAFRGCRILTNRLPPLKQVGLQEAGLALWFMGFLVLAFRF